MSTENQINPLQALIDSGKIRQATPIDPRNAEIRKPTSSVFPTGEFLGMQVSPRVQSIINELTLAPIGAGTAAGTLFSKVGIKKAAGQLKRTGSQLAEAIDNKFIPVDKNIEKKVIESFGTTKNIKFTPEETMDIYKTANKINQSITVPGTKGINLRREFYPNVYTGEAGVTYFGGSKKVPMLDIDLPEPKGGIASHASDQMPHNFKTHQDVYDHLDKMFDTPYMADASFRAYNTKAGVRLFDVNNRMSPLQYLMLTRYTNLLKSDPRYVGKSVVNFNPKQLSLDFKNRFDYRLSPKPGRVEPTIADYVGTLGPGQPNPKSVAEITRYHDDAIQALQEYPEARYSLGGLLRLLDK